MKKILFILMMLCIFGIGTLYAQVYNETPIFVEVSYSGLFPSSDSYDCTAHGIGVKFGKYITPIVGIGVEYDGRNIYQYDDESLSNIGLNLLVRPVQTPVIDVELSAGLHYGWYSWPSYADDWGYDYGRDNTSYVCFKFSPELQINLNSHKTFQFIVEPYYMYWNSCNETNFDSFNSFGVNAGFRFNF